MSAADSVSGSSTTISTGRCASTAAGRICAVLPGRAIPPVQPSSWRTGRLEGEAGLGRAGDARQHPDGRVGAPCRSSARAPGLVNPVSAVNKAGNVRGDRSEPDAAADAGTGLQNGARSSRARSGPLRWARSGLLRCCARRHPQAVTPTPTATTATAVPADAHSASATSSAAPPTATSVLRTRQAAGKSPRTDGARNTAYRAIETLATNRCCTVISSLPPPLQHRIRQLLGQMLNDVACQHQHLRPIPAACRVAPRKPRPHHHYIGNRRCAVEAPDLAGPPPLPPRPQRGGDGPVALGATRRAAGRTPSTEDS